MSNDRRIILNEYLRIGDIVVVRRNKDDDDNSVLPPDDTEAVVVSFDTYTRYVESDSCWHGQPLPGVYEYYGSPTFVYRDTKGVWTRGQLSPHHLVFQDDTFDKNVRRDDAHWQKATHGVWVGPLPELPFSVGDRVQQEYKRLIGTIERISYDNIGAKNGVGKPMGYLDVKLDEGGTMIGLHGEDLILIKRGNHYHYRRGEFDQMSFADLREEASFYSSVGKDEQLRSPKSGNYCWELEDALEAIGKGEGDVIRMSGAMFGSTPFPTLYRYPELPELGRRLREETLKGFEKQSA